MPESPAFELVANNGLRRSFDTVDAAIGYTRGQGIRVFEVRRIADDVQVYVEWPQPAWVGGSPDVRLHHTSADEFCTIVGCEICP